MNLLPSRSSSLVAAMIAACVGLARVPAQDPVGSQAAAPGEKGEGIRPPRPASSAVTKLSEELLELRRKIRAVESQAAERRRGQEARLEEIAAERRPVERSAPVLAEAVAKIEKEVAARKDLSGKEGKAASRLSQEAKAVVEPLRTYLDRLESHVTAGIPWRIEARKKAIEEVRKLVSDPATPAGRALKALGQLEEEEEALARLVEPGVVEVEVAGERKALPAIRFGALAIVFVSEDGSIAGYVKRGQKLEEGLLPEPAAAAAAPGYLAAVDVLRRRRAPCLVDIHIPSLTVGAEEEK